MSKPWRPKKITIQGGNTRSCDIWNLEFKTEDDAHFVKLVDGLVNNFTASNVGEWVEITNPNGYLLLSFQASDTSITSFVLEFSANLPAPIVDQQNVPVSSFKMFLARVSAYKAVSKFFRPLSIQPLVTRTVSSPPTQPAEDNTISYYTWEIHES